MASSSREALESLRISADMGDCDSNAVEILAAENAQLRSLVNRVIDAAVTRWHDPDKELELIDWLEISTFEYDEWVSRAGIFASDGVPYRVDDDAAIMRGYHAIKQMIIMRVGDQSQHAQAFRDALVEEDD